MGPKYQVSSKSVNRKWMNGQGHRTEWQTNKQTDTSTDNKGRLELSGAREPTDRVLFEYHLHSIVLIERDVLIMDAASPLLTFEHWTAEHFMTLVVSYCGNAGVWFFDIQCKNGYSGINLSWCPLSSKFSSYTCKHWTLFVSETLCRVWLYLWKLFENTTGIWVFWTTV